MNQGQQNELVIVPGADVIGTDGDKIGSVKEVFPDYITVEKGWFFPSEHYIPASAIRDANAQTVFLNVSKDDALQQGWEQPPTAAATETMTGAGVPRDTVAVSATGTDVAGVPRETIDRASAGAGVTQELDANETIRVPLAEEELTATTRPVERGGVRVTKDVEETAQTLDVPVREERVNVERRVVDRDVAPGATPFEETTIDVPVRGEDIAVQKRVRVGEELEISKDVTERTQHVSDTVRRERAHVEDLTGTTGEQVEGSNQANDVHDVTTTDESLIDQTTDAVRGTKKRRRR